MQDAHHRFDPGELARYSRQVILPQIGLEGQKRLKASKVLVVGAGGLGSPASIYLALAGVGTLGLADFDRVAVNNLHRQILHRTSSTGKLKVDSALEHLSELNPFSRYITHDDGITPANALSILSSYDLIVDGSDNFPTRYLLNDACFFARKPLVHGSIFQFEGQVSVFEPGHKGPCYRCLFPVMPKPGEVPNCSEAGVFGALCGVIGSLQAAEALKWITQAGESLCGKLSCIDVLNGRSTVLRIKQDPECPLCGSHPRLTSLLPENYPFGCVEEPVDEVEKEIPLEVQVDALAGHINDVVLLDVRESFEREICAIQPSLHVPMSKLSDSWMRLPSNKPLIVYCHHGMRSLHATQFLRHQGLSRVQSLRGGIDQWARQVDKTMARY